MDIATNELTEKTTKSLTFLQTEELMNHTLMYVKQSKVLQRFISKATLEIFANSNILKAFF